MLNTFWNEIEVHIWFNRGAVLILGGIMLNVWAAALLFQPVEEHMVKKYKDVEEDEDGPQVSCGVELRVGSFLVYGYKPAHY